MTTAFIGDVHGCLEPLREVVERAREAASTLVFLGDYVDRGHESREVIDYLVALAADRSIKCRFLAGNHDEELLRVLDGGELDLLLRMGGARTVRSYVAQPYGNVGEQLRQAVPRAHVEFLRALERVAVLDGVQASHEAQPNPEKLFTVTGHDVQPSLEPRISARDAFIDTGCGTAAGGRLTCLLWPSLEWFQSASPCDIE